MQARRVRINGQGRLVIPAALRAAAGLLPNSTVVLEVSGEGEVRLRSGAHGLARARAIARRYVKDARGQVDAFLAERRAEATRE